MLCVLLCAVMIYFRLWNASVVVDISVCLSRQLFVKPDGSLYKEGDIMKRPRLADTLEKIQNDPNALYEGSLAENIVEEIKGFGRDIVYNLLVISVNGCTV